VNKYVERKAIEVRKKLASAIALPQAWSAADLSPLAVVPGAHGGDKVNALCMLDGRLYSAGDDRVRAVAALRAVPCLVP
jgi:hypothetical protein